MRVLLQALPLPPYFSSSAKFPVDRVVYHFRRQSLEEHVAELGRSAGVQGFLNPRWRKRLGGIVLEAGLRQQAARLSSSGMAGAANGPPPLYRPNVGVCLLNAKNEVFVASRLDIPGAWQMPQGGIDEGEDPQAAAYRELQEETGIYSTQRLGEVPEWLTYNFPPDVKIKLTALWKKEWKGQAQKWFLLRFTGNECEINLLGDGTEKLEFSEWRWAPVEEVIRDAVDFKRPVYEQVFKHFVPLMKS